MKSFTASALSTAILVILSGTFLSTTAQAADCALPDGASLMETPEQSLEAFSTLRRELRVLDRRDADSFGQYAYWLESAANRFEYLPVIGVDKRITGFALESAQRLRNIALMYRDIGMISSISTNYYTSCATVGGYYSFYFGWYCNTFPDYTSRRVAARDAALFRLHQGGAMRAAMAQLRVCLVDDYNVDFR
jgi:hypothetical protein